MTEVAQTLPPRHSEIVYADSCSVAPASLNALTDVVGLPALNVARRIPRAGKAPDCETSIFFEGSAPNEFVQKLSRGAMDAALQALVEKAVSDALERAAQRVETLAGNIPYEKAWKRAAKEIRAFKPI